MLGGEETGDREGVKGFWIAVMILAHFDDGCAGGGGVERGAVIFVEEFV